LSADQECREECIYSVSTLPLEYKGAN